MYPKLLIKEIYANYKSIKMFGAMQTDLETDGRYFFLSSSTST